MTSSLQPQPLLVSAGGTSTTLSLPAIATPLSGPEFVIVNQITYSVIEGSISISATGSGTGGLGIDVPPATNTAQTFTLPDGIVLTIPASTPSTFYSLPTTVYTSNGVTQTFSQAQFTDLATITAQTTVTTTLAEVGYGSSSVTVLLLPQCCFLGCGRGILLVASSTANMGAYTNPKSSFIPRNPFPSMLQALRYILDRLSTRQEPTNDNIPGPVPHHQPVRVAERLRNSQHCHR